MPPFLNLDALAAKRGDGLRPELRALFERLATTPDYDSTVRSNGMVQSGPDPVSAKATFPQKPPRQKPNAHSAPALPAPAARSQDHQVETENDTCAVANTDRQQTAP